MVKVQHNTTHITFTAEKVNFLISYYKALWSTFPYIFFQLDLNSIHILCDVHKKLEISPTASSLILTFSTSFHTILPLV